MIFLLSMNVWFRESEKLCDAKAQEPYTKSRWLKTKVTMRTEKVIVGNTLNGNVYDCFFSMCLYGPHIFPIYIYEARSHTRTHTHIRQTTSARSARRKNENSDSRINNNMVQRMFSSDSCKAQLIFSLIVGMVCVYVLRAIQHQTSQDTYTQAHVFYCTVLYCVV